MSKKDLKKDTFDGEYVGQILLARPVSLKFFAAVSLIAILFAAVLIIWGEFTRKERVSGHLEYKEGAAKIYAPSTGVIAKAHVKEGDWVKGGQPLFVVNVERVTLAKGDTRFAIGKQLDSRKGSLLEESSRTRQMFSEDEASLRRKIDDAAVSYSRLEKEIEAQKEQVRLSKIAVDRYEDLVKQEFAPRLQWEEKQQTYFEKLARLHRLEQEAGSTQSALKTLKSELANLPRKASNQMAQLDRAMAEVEQETLDNESKRQIVVVATQEGRVTAVLGREGQIVTSDLPLLTILPNDAKLTAFLYIPSSAVGFISPGKQVLLKYQSFPYQKFGQYKGVVSEVAQTALTGRELQEATLNKSGYYLATVSLESQFVNAYGKKIALQDGMQLEADVLLDTRKLYEWIFEPIYSIKGRL